MKRMYGGTPGWAALMKCNNIYIKDRKTAIGVTGTRYGLFFAENPANPIWSPDVGANMLTCDEKACLDAQQARYERMQASLKTAASLTHTVMEKNREAKERIEQVEKLNKQIENMQKNFNELHKRTLDKHKETVQEMLDKNYWLRRENDAMARRCAETDRLNLELRSKLENEKQRNVNRLFELIKWLGLAIFVFALVSHLDGAFAEENTSKPDRTGLMLMLQHAKKYNPEYLEMLNSPSIDSMFKGYKSYTPRKLQLDKCEEPNLGCVARFTFFRENTYTFYGLMDKCRGKRGTIDISAFDPLKVKAECVEAFGEEWCYNIIPELVPHMCKQESYHHVLYKQIEEMVTTSLTFYNWLTEFKIDFWVTVIFSLIVTGKKEKTLYALPFILVAWWFKLPVFVVCVAANIFPPVLYVFLLLQVVFPQYFIITAFFVWITYMLVAFLWNEGVSVLVEVSYSVVYVGAFFLWSTALTVCAGLQMTTAMQIIIFSLVTAAVTGTRYACSTVTVVHPDGSVVKTSRIMKAKTTFAQQAKKVKMFLQARGIIPSSPVKTASVVIVVGKNGTGTGFRYMNYIATAGHVVDGSEWATVKTGDISVKVKKDREIILPECPDTLVLFKITKELQGVKPLKLAHNLQSAYMTLHGYCANFVNPVSFTGWCIVDNPWINNTFNTTFGNSGAPYCDSDGKLVGIHLGTQGVTSQGIVVADTLRKLFDPLYQCKECKKEQFEMETNANIPEWFNYDKFLMRVIEGTKWSHQAILQHQEELQERIEKIELLLTRAVLAEEKKKGKTKKTARGAKHTVTKKYLTKGHFMKMKMLSEEEYQKLMDEGFSADEIREVVNNLREQAWLEYCIDNDIDDEGAEEWYDDMIETDRVNEEIDANVERQMEEEGYYAQAKARKTLKEKVARKSRKTFAEQALMHLIDIKPEKVRTVKIEVQEESSEKLSQLFSKMVSDDDVVEGTTKALLSNGDDIKYLENKEINWDKLKMIRMDDEQKFENITRSGNTQISTGEDNKKNILKEKVTNLPPSGVRAQEKKEGDAPKKEEDKKLVLEQRKRVCRTCGSDKPHNFAACKRKNELCFCVWCGEMHSENQGHTRKVACPKCAKEFAGIESLEKHAIEGCSKN
ncbi:nonstructural polyprotein [Duck astrovirus]|nr:nonstructural polyprotein [Duck astrovirus]